VSPADQPPAREEWRPTSSLRGLRRRAQLLARTRRFFAARGVLEVDTPLLIRRAVTDVHLHSAEVQLPGTHTPLYLQTSPEYAMKRLLAAGSGDIYQIAHAVRGQEHSRWHNAEFTLVEWYRLGWSLHALMEEVAQLATTLLGEAAPTRTEFVSYDEAFLRVLGCSALTASVDELRERARAGGLDVALASDCTRDELLDWLMATRIGPHLGTDSLCLLHRYPASQAALARLDPQDARVALRFELYCRGVELANGFEELGDAAEQRARFEADQHERQRRGLPVPEIDTALLAALQAGLPPCAGVALGFDRVLMLALGARSIEEVLPFPTERA
jgi:lysyl-tRNA synthetase class 2